MKRTRILTRILPLVFLLLFSPMAMASADAPDEALLLRVKWANARYQITDTRAQIKAMTELASEAEALSAKYPNTADPIVVHAAIISTRAELLGSMDALDDVTEARRLLTAAEKMNSTAMDGYIYTLLGALYHKVPGWPLSYGNDAKAESYFKRALAIDANAIDANYFYGQFAHDKGDDAKARVLLEKALAAAPRPGLEVADAGRRTEINALISQLSSH